MEIGGLQQTSLLDYPDHISAIIWTMGCNFHCPFCYNTDIVNRTAPLLSEKDIIEFLQTRQKLLEGVVITGGEPLLQNDLPQFLKKIKTMDYLIKVDTNGSLPEYLQKLLENKLIDYVAMDVKAPPEKYQKITNSTISIEKIFDSINIIKELAPDYEFRTTYVPDYLTKKDIVKIALLLKDSKRYYLQQYKHDSPHISSRFDNLKPYSKKYINETYEEIKDYFKECHIRGL